ncbi:unnamed protein product [Effrenium voratum]|uniref:Flavin-containing monooxygenase n=1 Tax=Effrenium voratum TaxID=2562239 RepID=A0AA36JEB2_9DINO|nr:unnamed protein product [Effrenium voratum]CAJ1404067.1 unnamed protein product [Effrenium voratum]CAJ1421912.1 unnamed protein product [Effrenium voratum]|mmetsp:Transcript_61313/g.146151  ORF Transcript_61313/g.146151 Transcript_61313/m.146151 type:complete len:649 (+) Transcript_61313:67-2013(+)
MPARPPIYMGQFDPENFRDPSKVSLVQHSKAMEEMSKTAREIELSLQSTGEVLRIPAQVSTTVWDIKLMMADKLGRDPGEFTFLAKQGPFWRENRDSEEIRSKVVVKNLKSWERERTPHEHPIVIIGAGHIGLRQAMVFLKYNEYNFVIFDRKPKVGGMAWWDQANVTSKLQTEVGVYHLGWDETLPCPTNDYPWPSRDELLQMFQDGANEYGIMPYCRLQTEVKDVKTEGAKLDTKYEVTIQKLAEPKAKDETIKAGGVMLYPGNLSLPRRETYKGEDEFGGTIAYGMFDEFGYNEATGKDIAIIGHGAFAVENVRSCCEYSCKKIYLVCRRKNIACPRFVSWLANQSASPLSASLFLHSMKPMYDLMGWDPWTYYAVQGNAARTNCNIQQKARFGIGDVYFCALSWGKLEVIEDPLGIKRLGHHALHCGNGRKIDVQCILKLLGFVGDPSHDKVMHIKELVGFWVNDDPRRYVVAEPVSVMATNFGGTSFSPGAISWAEQGMHFMHHPKDLFEKVLPTGMVPRHKADESDEGTYRPAYVVDARHGTQTGIFIGSLIPWVMERGPIHSRLKVSRMWTLHPIDKFVQYCKEDWDHYCKKFRDEGLSGSEFPYTPEEAHRYLEKYRGENRHALKESPDMIDYYESFLKK